MAARSFKVSLQRLPAFLYKTPVLQDILAAKAILQPWYPRVPISLTHIIIGKVIKRTILLLQ